MAQVIAAPAVVGAAPLYGAHLIHKRSADPSLILGHGPLLAPKCETVTDKVCAKVPVNTPKTIKVPHCTAVPKEDCKEIKTQVPETECKDVPRKVCTLVPKEVSHSGGTSD